MTKKHTHEEYLTFKTLLWWLIACGIWTLLIATFLGAFNNPTLTQIAEAEGYEEVCVEHSTLEGYGHLECMATCIDLDFEGDFTCQKFCDERYPEQKICTTYVLRRHD